MHIFLQNKQKAIPKVFVLLVALITTSKNSKQKEHSKLISFTISFFCDEFQLLKPI